MAQHGGRKQNFLIFDNFKEIIINVKCPQHQCIHCGHQSIKSTSRSLQHLNQCAAYKNAMIEKTEASSFFVQPVITNMIRLLNQAQIIPAHRAAAMSVYMTNLPFNHFESSYVIIHHQTLNPSYKSPHSGLLAGRLLNEAYEITKSKINAILNAFKHLSFFTDETTNIRKKRIINLCCHVPPSVILKGGSFQLKAVANVTEKMTAVVQAE